MKTAEQIAADHLDDLRTRRRDVLDDYIRTAGATDWVYTEEELSEACAGNDGLYLASLRLVY